MVEDCRHEIEKSERQEEPTFLYETRLTAEIKCSMESKSPVFLRRHTEARLRKPGTEYRKRKRTLDDADKIDMIKFQRGEDTGEKNEAQSQCKDER